MVLTELRILQVLTGIVRVTEMSLPLKDLKAFLLMLARCLRRFLRLTPGEGYYSHVGVAKTMCR